MLTRFTTATALGLTALALALPQGAMAQDRTTVEWWYANGGRIEEAIQQMIADFNESQPDYEVVGVRKGNYEETFAAMIAAYRAGQHPTIIQASERSVLTMLNSNAIVPVHQLMEEHGHSLDQDSFLGPVAAFYVVDGEVSALPFNSSTGIMWYNADHFDAAGFSDGPAATWEEFETQLYTLKDQGITECAMVLNSDFVWSLVEGFATINNQPFGTLANGRDGLGTEYVYNTTRVVEQVERLKKWVDDGVIQLSGQGMSPGQLFTSGTCSTWSSSTAVTPVSRPRRSSTGAPRCSRTWPMSRRTTRTLVALPCGCCRARTRPSTRRPPPSSTMSPSPRPRPGGAPPPAISR